MARSTYLERLLSKRGICSRAEARRAILAGEVEVDGRPCRDPLQRVPVHVRISRRGTPSGAAPPPRVVLALHKPRGTITTARDPEGRATVYDLLPPGIPRLVPVGRLDAASRGLLLMTNDTVLADRLTAPASHVSKTYHVRLDRHLPPDVLARMASGMRLEDGPTRPCGIRLLRAGRRTCWLEIVLTEGRNRQIRRMAEAAGATVTDLVRVAIGELPLGDLKAGSSRVLTEREVSRLFAPLRTDAPGG